MLQVCRDFDVSWVTWASCWGESQVKGTCGGLDLMWSGLEYWFCHLLAVWPGTNHLLSLAFSFLMTPGDREVICIPPGGCEGQVREYSGKRMVGMVNFKLFWDLLQRCNSVVRLHLVFTSRTSQGPPSIDSTLCQESSQAEVLGDIFSHSCFKKKSWCPGTCALPTPRLRLWKDWTPTLAWGKWPSSDPCSNCEVAFPKSEWGQDAGWCCHETQKMLC